MAVSGLLHLKRQEIERASLEGRAGVVETKAPVGEIGEGQMGVPEEDIPHSVQHFRHRVVEVVPDPPNRPLGRKVHLVKGRDDSGQVEHFVSRCHGAALFSPPAPLFSIPVETSSAHPPVGAVAVEENILPEADGMIMPGKCGPPLFQLGQLFDKMLVAVVVPQDELHPAVRVEPHDRRKPGSRFPDRVRIGGQSAPAKVEYVPVKNKNVHAGKQGI